MGCPLSVEEAKEVVDIMPKIFDPKTDFIPKCPKKDECGKENDLPCGTFLGRNKEVLRIKQIGRRNGGALW